MWGKEAEGANLYTTGMTSFPPRVTLDKLLFQALKIQIFILHLEASKNN